MIDFGDFEVTLIKERVPEVKSDFLLSMYRCMKASLTSRRILALTSLFYCSIPETKSNQLLLYTINFSVFITKYTF